MLFNSHEFIFFFLPITIIGFFFLGSRNRFEWAMRWLVCCSLFFYAWWNPVYLIFIVFSIVFNYHLGSGLSRPQSTTKYHQKLFLIMGITTNLALLGYFKYANFFVENVNLLFRTDYFLTEIALPLAISFFTFQQIAYLIDAYKKETSEYNFRNYCLFVTFFPQLIAGPIVHHKEMLPQFGNKKIYRPNPEFIAVGVTIFMLGLFKKVVLADNAAVYATPVFEAAEQGVAISFFDAWVGALAYTFQLYFDFSGYSDMAIGIAKMFGISLPLNFNSPYKAVNIVSFWRCWHITLSRFLRDYLYIPLGGNKKGKTRRYINLMTTMVLGGLWHGAGWTFVIWGALHGCYLVINHAWHSIRKNVFSHDLKQSSMLGRALSRILTFIVVVVAWVFFRAETADGAINILARMFDFSQMVLPGAYEQRLSSVAPILNTLNISFAGEALVFNPLSVLLIILLFFIVWFMPSTPQLLYRYSPVLNAEVLNAHGKSIIKFSPNIYWITIVAVLGSLAIISLTKVSEFLYFQF